MTGITKTIDKSKRPVYLNLFRIRLPVMAVVSLAHRVSGILLFIAIPFIIYLLDLSVISSEGFQRVMTMAEHPALRFTGVLLAWSLAHHFFAGVRFLLIDADIGVVKPVARFSAWLVMLLEVLTVALVVYGVLL